MIPTLERFALASRDRAVADMMQRSLAELEDLTGTLPPVRPFAARLTRSAGPLPRVVAEMKRSSPSAGLLRHEYQPGRIAMGYARVGAAALSVLTEPDEFGGSLDHLSEARPARLPILRKDFLVTPYQVAQARAAGADAVLLITAILNGPSLAIMISAARRYGVEALVEIHDEDELKRALDAGACLIGVNNRDLRTMEVSFGTAARLAPLIPSGVPMVAESGIRSRADIDKLMAAGYEAFLVGEHLMRADDSADALRALMQPVR